MSDNYKRRYEVMRTLVTAYQNELIPGYRAQVERLEAEVARIKENIRGDCAYCGERAKPIADRHCNRCIWSPVKLWTEGDYWEFGGSEARSKGE